MNWFRKKSEKKAYSKMLGVYLSGAHNKILVAPYFTDGSGVYFEQDDIEVLPFDISDDLLGEALRRNLDKFEVKEANFNKRKLTDWPTYKASGSKTVKEFEKRYSKIAVSGLNEANIILAMDAEMKSKHEIDLRTIISAYANNRDLGVRLRMLHKAQVERKI